MSPLKKFSPESIRAIARNPNSDLQSIVIYSKSDKYHHIGNQQFQELLPKMDTIESRPTEQKLRKLAETEGFSNFYKQDDCGYFKQIRDYIFINGEKYRLQDLSPINFLVLLILILSSQPF